MPFACERSLNEEQCTFTYHIKAIMTNGKKLHNQAESPKNQYFNFSP